jgi:hypothetical protein
MVQMSFKVAHVLRLLGHGYLHMTGQYKFLCSFTLEDPNSFVRTAAIDLDIGHLVLLSNAWKVCIHQNVN